MSKTLRNTVMICLLTAMGFTAKAQVFMTDADEGYREPADPNVFVNMPSDFGMGTDSYIPIGDGALLLAALGGAYLLGRKKK